MYADRCSRPAISLAGRARATSSVTSRLRSVTPYASVISGASPGGRGRLQQDRDPGSGAVAEKRTAHHHPASSRGPDPGPGKAGCRATGADREREMPAGPVPGA